MRIGICDTTFARFDMGAAAIDELKNQATIVAAKYIVIIIGFY